MRNKIILGSANFDQIYGIKKNSIKKSEIKKLFDLALKNEIKIISQFHRMLFQGAFGPFHRASQNRGNGEHTYQIGCRSQTCISAYPGCGCARIYRSLCWER